MLSFALKAVWFSFSLSGLICCWIVLVSFANVVQLLWSPLLYCVCVTLMQGVFCLGLLWRMDPLEMPRAFCIAQDVLINIGSFVLAGVTASFTLGAMLSQLRPYTLAGFTPSSFSWHPRYLLLTAVLPAVASVVYIAVLLRLDAVVPMDDLQCEATRPIWVRLLGYAGVPLLLSIPNLVASSFLAFRMIQKQGIPSRLESNSRGCSYIRQNTMDGLTPLPIRRHSRRSKSLEFRASAEVRNENTPTPTASQLAVATPIAIPSPTSSAVFSSPHLLQSPGRIPTSPEVASFANKYHLPFNRRPRQSPSPDLRPASRTRSSAYFPSDTSISSVFPTFAPPSRSGSVKSSVKSLPAFPDHLDALHYNGVSSRDNEPELSLIKMVSSTAVGGDAESELRWARRFSMSKSELEFVRDIEAENGTEESYEPTYVRRNPLSNMMRDKTTPPPVTTPPVLGHIVIFQIVLSIVQILASITTLVDVAKRRTIPTSFGTQHFALLLAAWCPCFIFGSIPGVRQRLMFWKRRRFS
ncbi:hypothetical protein OE88DRAFT_1727206 [Heliocybe sulcata]|uniref:Uncharacterized protein n=1 Tax=Heliocybe sulcata TaxID=5364 RepID=A0A5C3N077_9AGAM|nr:hypothetical protein OE88DRAFT_1727206 [Heliocybe sulcata]